MVDALRDAWRVLRTGGVVIDLLPAADYAPRIAIASGRRRSEIGTITRTPDESVNAAHQARRKAIAEGRFTLAVLRRGAHRSRYDRLADVRWLLRQNENWRIEPQVRRRLAAAWARRPDGAQLEIRRAFSLAILRRRG